MDENLACPTCTPGEADQPVPDLSIIIPAHNAQNDLRACLESVTRHVNIPHEIIVIDDASTDQTAQIAQEFGVVLLRKNVRGGPASARNWGAQVAQSSWILFLDADVELLANTIPNAFKHISQHNDMAALFGSYDSDPTHKTTVSQFRNLLHHHVHQTGQFYNNLRPANTFWTGCGFIRREIFLALGGLDHWLFEKPAIEDVEFGYRMTDAGHKVYLGRDVLCRHRKRWTLASMVRTDFFQRGLPWSLLMIRSGRPSNDLNVDRMQKVAALAAGSFWLSAAGMVISLVVAIPLAMICLAVMVLINRGFFRLLWKIGGIRLLFPSLGLMNFYYIVCLTSYLAASLIVIRQRLLMQLSPNSKPCCISLNLMNKPPLEPQKALNKLN